MVICKKKISLDYRFKPFGTRKISYLIEPRHVISLEDLALMIKQDCIYRIAHGIISKQLPLYFHYKTEEEGQQQNMLCFPLEFYFEYQYEYYLVRHRIYFLKRDVQTFFDNNQDITILDNVLKVPKERVADENNVKTITKNIIQRMCVVRDFGTSSYISAVSKAFWVLFVLLSIFLKTILLLPIILYDYYIHSKTYSTKSLNSYDGATLSAMTFAMAQSYVNTILEEHKTRVADLKKHTDLRAILAMTLSEFGLSPMDIGKLLHHTAGKGIEADSLERVVRDWIAVGKKNRKKQEVSPEKSALEEEAKS